MLTPYIKAEGLNSGMTGTSLVVEGVGNLKDGLDKRSGGVAGGVRAVKDVINIAKSIADSISNLSGVRSPYYVIGEVPSSKETERHGSAYKYGAAGNLFRAVTKFFYDKVQEGVIIDCLGDVTGNMSIEFTKNPLIYQSSSVIDSRVRKPTTVKATVAVSNYLSDNLLGAMANTFNQVFGNITTQITNELLYDGNTRAQQALYKLRWLLENAVPFTLYTPHGLYENMLIESLQPKTDASTMDCLMCEITFREVIMWRPYFSGKNVDNIPARKNIARVGKDGKFETATNAYGKGVGNFFDRVGSWLT